VGKAERERQAAARSAKRRAQAQAAQRRKIMIRLSIVAVVALLVAGGIAITVINSQPEAEAKAPVGADAQEGLGIAFNADITPVVNVWEDFQCPACATFEAATGDYLASLAREGRAKVVYHVLSFLGPESVTAANASACAADEGKFLEFHKLLYANQPSENSGEWNDKKMIEYGAEVGATSETFKQCVNDRTYRGWVNNISSDGSRRNVNATPTVWVNGKDIDRSAYANPEALDEILKAAGMK
jgi:protein-disulfide isomerase